jgi:hypothetical protein
VSRPIRRPVALPRRLDPRSLRQGKWNRRSLDFAPRISCRIQWVPRASCGLRLVFGTAGSTTKRRVPHPLQFFAKGGIRDRRYRDSWHPTLRKKREGPRISYCAAPALVACAAFYKESRMKFVDPTKLYRKSGGMGHPGISCTFCRGQEMPLFMPRGSATPVDDFAEKPHTRPCLRQRSRKSGYASVLLINNLRPMFIPS